MWKSCSLRTMLGLLVIASSTWAGHEIDVSIDFSKLLQDWDGFGVNYVEYPMSRDYAKHPEEYGGFSTLSRQKREEILDLLFGEEGLKPGLLKMFLDPIHEGLTKAGNDNDDPHRINMDGFDHETTTKWMRYFAHEGLKRTRARGADLQIVTTLYGPPPWTTLQKVMRGRDLDPAEKYELAEYMVSWVKYLKEEEKLPVKYISLHNEGEDIYRWPMDGSWSGYRRMDHNAYWHCTAVVDFLKIMRPMLDRHGLQDVGITPGETSSWDRFANWGYAYGIYQDEEALNNLGLITSHGFGGADPKRQTDMGVSLLRVKRPELHAWTTSFSWGKMDMVFLDSIYQQIYKVGVNGIIPWAALQTLTWFGGDPNPGTALFVDRKGGYEVKRGYHLYKHVTRAGQPGMKVAKTVSEDADVRLIAFSQNGTGNPDSFVVFQTGGYRIDLRIDVKGSRYKTFACYVTNPRDTYEPLEDYSLRKGAIECTIFPNAVMTFFGKE